VHTLGTHFDKLIQNLKPPPERFAAARDLPWTVREYLAAHEDFVTVDPHTRLVGSYAQDLSVGDVKDVDILIRADGDPAANDPEAKRVIRDLRSALVHLPEWDKLPEWLGYGGRAEIDVERARRSVHIFFAGHDFHLDIVPCIAPDGFDQPIWVPDFGLNRWVRSHPLGVVELITELNRNHGQKVRPLGKLFKHFRNHQMKTRRPKSYWLVALLLQQIRDSRLDLTQPSAVAFRDLLDGIYTRYHSLLPRTDGATPNIPDPMLGHNVSWNWDRSHFVSFMNRLDDGRRWATNALEANDQNEAITWWQRVFGEDYFPSDIGDYARILAAAGAPGTSYTTGAGLILPHQLPTGISTPIRQTTFHGDTNE
jgi:hypothetical protein